MNYFIFTKKIKIYSILAVILPVVAFSLCILLYSILGNFKSYVFPKDIDWKNNQSTFYKWNERTGISDEKITNFSFVNCYKVIIDRHVVLKNGDVLIDKFTLDTGLTGQDKIFNNALEKNEIKGLFYKKGKNKDKKCIKNKPIIYNALKKYPKLDAFLSNIQQTYTKGFVEIKNPFLYGEVSISRTARYFPASLIFKPLIILSAIFLFFYWLNNLRVFNLMKNNSNSELRQKTNKFFIFGILSAIFLILHSIFLGVENQHEFFKFFRRFIIIFFIIFEIIAQILLTYSLYSNKTKLNEIINFPILKIKIIFVAIAFLFTIISFWILGFADPSTAFKNILEWNYFIFLLFYYVLSYFLWKKSKNLVHTPEGV